MKATIKLTVIVSLLLFSTASVSAQYSKKNTRNFLNKTSYIIGEAYDMVYYYGYYSNGYLSKAVNHQNYAKFLYNIGNLRNAVYHSDLARRYALRVIYNSTNYWDNYYRPHYYSYHPSHPHGNQPSYNNNNNNRPSQNNSQYGHRNSTTTVTSTTRSNNNNNGGNAPRVSKYASSGDVVSMETWERNYYSSEERSLVGTVSVSERDLEAAVANNNNIRRVSNDDEVMKNGIKDFSSDISTYRNSNQTEAKTIAISRPADLGTTTETTRSTAVRTAPAESRPVQTSTSTQTRTTTTQPTQTRAAEPTQSKQTDVRSTQTTPTTTTRSTESKPTQTQATQTRTQTPTSTQTRQEQAKPAQTTPTQNQRTNSSSTQTKTSQPTQTSTQPTRSTSSGQDAKKESTTTQKTTTAPRSR